MGVFIKKVVFMVSLIGLLTSCGDEVTLISGDTTQSGSGEPAPIVVGAISTSNTSVSISYSKPMSDSAILAGNYSIAQKSLNGEAGALFVVAASFYDSDHKTVLLTTLSQNELTYEVTVTNVQDTFGQPFEVVSSNTGFHTADNATFAGTPPDANSIADSDGDGLLDNEEQRGWLISVVNANGEVLLREVTSNPNLADTDGDGLSDSVERSLNTDPRSQDTDGDLLGDAHEYNGIFSSPSIQDTDNDGLMDGEEVNFFRTSPLLDDSDGDQILDGDEIILANRNARIADLAQPTIEIESITLELDVRFDKTLNANVTTTDENFVSSTLTQSSNKSYARTNEENNQVSASVTVGTEFDINPFNPNAKITASATAGVQHGWSSSWSSESSKATQNEYNKSLKSSEALAEGVTVSRRIESAKVSTLVYLAAVGDVAFTIRDLQITALVADIRNPGKYLPVATLVPEIPEGSSNEFNLGPLADKIGPLIFIGEDIFPAQVERLMRDPSGVIFKISNYNITDESERNFAYTSQDVVDRTSSISLDFGGTESTGTALGEGTEFYRVATSFGQPIGSIVDAMALEQQMTPTQVRAAYGLAFDDVDSLISFDLSGKNIGVAFHDVMQNVLGLKHYDSGATDTDDPSDQLTSYATTFNSKGVERITRIRQTENTSNRQWSLLTPTGLILDAQLSFGEGAAAIPNDQVLLAGSGISLAFVTDKDGDLIPARLEYLHGCSDSVIDTDGDGLSDYLEVFGAAKNADGAYANIDDKWVVDVKSIGLYEGFSSCGSKDSDGDGIPDYYEYHSFDSVNVTLNDDGSEDITFTPYTGPNPTPRTDAKSQDTDGDGITDFDERFGYEVQLRFPRLTTEVNGVGPSECTDLDDDTISKDGIELDKVECTTDPLNPHSDGDAHPDGAEFAFFADPTVNDAGDVSDIDGDGLLGREEKDGWPVTFIYDGMINFYSSIDPLVLASSIPAANPTALTCEPDIAGCLMPLFGGYLGIANYVDAGVFPTSSPVIQDTDDDGLTDDIENDISLANTGYVGSTHPREVDTDQDGRPDFEELNGFPYKEINLAPSKPYKGTKADPKYTDPLVYDSDGDGLSDGEEVNNPYTVKVLRETAITVYSNPGNPDSDGDGLTDAQEKDEANGKSTNPLVANTDADPYSLEDGIEQALGINPLDPNDICLEIQFTGLSCVECNTKEVDLSVYPLIGGLKQVRTYLEENWNGGSPLPPPAYLTLDEIQKARIIINNIELWDTVGVPYVANKTREIDAAIGDYESSASGLTKDHFAEWSGTDDDLPSVSSIKVTWTTSVMIAQNVTDPTSNYCK